jgi:Bax protein
MTGDDGAGGELGEPRSGSAVSLAFAMAAASLSAPWTRRWGARAIAAVVLLLAFAPRQDQPVVAAAGDGTVLNFAGIRQLGEFFDAIGYTLAALHRDSYRVPRLYLNRVPGDWAEDLTISSKKSVFFRTLLPAILYVNERVMVSRQRLLAMQRALDSGKTLAGDDPRWLLDLARLYRLDTPAPAEADGGRSRAAAKNLIAELLLRVDVVPVSLALGQAAYESGYATSRFSAEGNAFFGQRAVAAGMMPKARENIDWRVASFESPMASVVAYVAHLNTHPAYRQFRKARADQRKAGALNGLKLAETMTPYAEIGPDYVRTLRRIIAENQLVRLDSVGLDEVERSFGQRDDVVRTIARPF